MSGDPLYQVDTDLAAELQEADERLVLIHTLAGFMDAGGANALAAKHLRKHCSPRTLVTFDADDLIDHRERRPPMHFATDRYTDIELPSIRIDVMNDGSGARFLALTGLEPTFRWDKFTRATVKLAQEFGVSLAVGLNAIPWNTPHTRPVALTPHATDRSLISGRPRWVEDLDIPGSVGALLELRLGEADVPACGFAAHVPHYLSTTDYPTAAVALLDAVCETTGLQLDVGRLKEAGAQVLAEVDAQVADSAETAEAVAALEQQYDAQAAGEATEGMPSPHLPDDELGSGDKVVADLERWLRDLGNEPGSGPGPGRE